MLDRGIIEVEKRWAQSVVTNAKSILLRNKKIATGNLYNSITYNVSLDGDISFSYAEEGKWVEQGRRKGDKFPPPAPISRWIRQKGIKGVNKDGKPLTNGQLTFLISRAIARDGIKPVPFMQLAIDEATQQLMVDLEKSLAAYYDRLIAKA